LGAKISYDQVCKLIEMMLVILFCKDLTPGAQVKDVVIFTDRLL